MREFVRLEPRHLLAIDRQESQRLLMGVDAEMSGEEAETLAEQRIAWALLDAGRIVGCFGITEPFPGVHGVAWALLGKGIGGAHLEMTRFCKRNLAQCGLQRVDVITRSAEARPWLGGNFAVADAMRHPSPECRWAALLGMRPAHYLFRYGALGEPHMLFEWFPEYAAPTLQAVA